MPYRNNKIKLRPKNAIISSKIYFCATTFDHLYYDSIEIYFRSVGDNDVLTQYTYIYA